MSEAKPNGVRDVLAKVALGGGAGVGALLAYAAMDLLKTQPALLKDFGWPLATFGMFCVAVSMLHFDVSRGIGALNAMGKANERLTGEIHEMASARARENELVMDAMAENFSTLLNAQQQMREELSRLVEAVNGTKGRAGVTG